MYEVSNLCSNSGQLYCSNVPGMKPPLLLSAMGKTVGQISFFNLCMVTNLEEIKL